MEEPKAGPSAVPYWRKRDVLRSINCGIRMSEQLRNAMEQGERMRNLPSRNENRMEKKRGPADGWSWNEVEWPTIRSNMKAEVLAKNERSAKHPRRVPPERSGSVMQ
jgi:hypothetical protein